MTLRLLQRWILASVLLVLGLAHPSLGQGAVNIELDQTGLGGSWRPGDVTGVRLSLTALADSPLEEATPIWVQWEVPNVDGDIAEYGRPLTLTKGKPTSVWLYAPTHPQDSSAVWTFRVFAYVDGEMGPELSGARLSPQGQVWIENQNKSMIAVVGSSAMQLDQLGLNVRPLGSGLLRTAHEDTLVIPGLRPEDLPDRWEGYRSLEALGWSDALPQDLRDDQVEAIVEWVRRGGHLIISLPEVGNPWGLGSAGQIPRALEQLMPAQPRKDPGVPRSALVPVLTKANGLWTGVPDFPVSIHVFQDLKGDFDVVDPPYEPRIALPDGRVIVVQRRFGHGLVTVIGVDLSSTQLSSVRLSSGSFQMPQADAFWNRILGRRADTPLASEVKAIDESNLLIQPANLHEAAIGRADVAQGQINMSGKAGVGLLLALGLFAVYWVVAGPGGYYGLKSYKLVRHSWLAFAACAVVFTAVAWLGVWALRGRDVTVRHLTVLDIISDPSANPADTSDPPLQHARSWMSIYLPGYGTEQIDLDSMEAQGVAFPDQRDLLYSWIPPDVNVQAFPNVARYQVNVREEPDDIALPKRSTATQLKADWMGGVSAEWGGLLRSDPNNPVRVEIDNLGNEVLRGSVISDLPATLRDTTIIWVRNATPQRRRYLVSGDEEESRVPLSQSGMMTNLGDMWRLQQGGRLNPGGVIDLGALETGRTLLSSNIDSRYVRPLATSAIQQVTLPGGAMSNSERWTALEMLSFFHQLTPPRYLLDAPDSRAPEVAVFNRRVGRELDLSKWFTRPCVIVMGFLDHGESPIPLRLGENGGRAPEYDDASVTMVRWICPLPVKEEVAFRNILREPGVAVPAAPR